MATAYARATRYDVIAFIDAHEKGHPGRVQQLARALAQAGHRVFLVRRMPAKRGAAPLRVLGPNLCELVLTVSDTPVEAVRRLEALRREAGIATALCLIEDPTWTAEALELRRRFGFRLVFDYAASACLEPSVRDQAEMSEILGESDLVLVASEDLLAKAPTRDCNCLVIPDAADFDRFRFPPHTVPAKMESLPRPTIACFGLECEAFDLGLVRSLAQSRPGWSLLCVSSGPGGRVLPPQDLPNVHSLEVEQYGALPEIVHASDVCLVPMRDVRGCEAGVRLRVLDLLSSAKPLLASCIPDLEQYKALVELAPDLEGWIGAIERALNARPARRADDAIAFARANTWRDRAAELEQGLDMVFPRASIIVLSYNNLDYTRLCLDSIRENTLYPNVETIVVDNASSDGSREYLQVCASKRPSLKVVLNQTNEGFARANNRGLEAATGEYLVLLNNDTIVTRGWLSRLTRHLQDPAVGLVGPVTNRAPNQSRIPVAYRGLEEIDAFAESYAASHDGQTFDIPMLLFFCVAMRRSVYEAVGRLDERFGVGLCEDRDYAYRVKQAGFRVVCAEDVFVHHFGSASFSKLGQAEYGRLFERNRRLLEEKWGVPWDGHDARD